MIYEAKAVHILLYLLVKLQSKIKNKHSENFHIQAKIAVTHFKCLFLQSSKIQID